MTDCVFCKIIDGDIPSTKVYEDDNVYAFLDINPNQRGHTLVIPKSHSTDLVDMSEKEINAVFTSVKRLAPAVMSAVGSSAFNLGMNNGATAGQVVFHAHVHIITRFEDDGLTHWPKLKGYDKEDFPELAETIRQKL